MSLKFNSPAFAIRYLQRRKCLVAVRPATDIPKNDKPILTFAQNLYLTVQDGDCLSYLRDHGYKTMYEQDVVAKIEDEARAKALREKIAKIAKELAEDEPL